MADKQPSEEIVVKEYPHSTRWLKGQQVIGSGNLILTSKRLVFLHEVVATDEQIEKMQKIAERAPVNRLLDFAISLYKQNFQIPLASLVLVKVGLYSLFPFPRPCLRVFYGSGRKKGQMKTVSFMFTIPLLRGFFQFEITTVLGWVWSIRRVLRYRQETAAKTV